MKKLCLVSALVLSGCVADGPSSDPKPSRAQLICAEEFTIGTTEFSQCVALLKAQDASLRDYEKEKKEENEVISKDLAAQICNEKARAGIFKPIERMYTPWVVGNHRKDVNLTYVLEGESKRYNVKCVMDGRKIIDMKVS